MKPGTHNLGRNARAQLALVRVDANEVRIQLGATSVVLSHDQAKLLKEVFS